MPIFEPRQLKRNSKKMQHFEPGDEVSFMLSNLRGKVLHRIDKQQVMVEIEDGFEIPAFNNELVLVKRNSELKEENKPDTDISSKQEIKTFTHSGIAVQKGVFLGFVLQDDKKSGKAQVHCYLINSTKDELLFAIFAGTEEKIKGIAKGETAPNKAIQFSTFALEDSDSYKSWHVQVLKFQKQVQELPEPIVLSLKFKEANLLKSQQELPLIGLQGWLISLEAKEKLQEKNIENEDFYFKQNEEGEIIKVERVSDIVDLHLDTLQEKEKPLANGEALQLQMQHFINSLEKAYAFGLPKIIFIHGVGNGILKNKIKEHLKKQDFVTKILDADPKKFGYGATEVYLKMR